MSTAVVQYGRLLLAQWRWVMWGVLSVLLLLTAVMVVSPPMYRSTATVFVRTPGDISKVQDGGDLYARLRTDTYAALARGTGVSSRIVSDLGLRLSPEQFSARVEANGRPNTALLDLAVKGPGQSEVQRQLTVLINELQSTVHHIEAVPGSVVPRAELVVVNPPGNARRVWAWGLPLGPTLAGAALFGAALGALGAVLRSMFVSVAHGGRDEAWMSKPGDCDTGGLPATGKSSPDWVRHRPAS
jgi:hypothetical protein